MNGRFDRRPRRAPCSSTRPFALALCIALLAPAAGPVPATAQSGRNRDRPPAADPAPPVRTEPSAPSPDRPGSAPAERPAREPGAPPSPAAAPVPVGGLVAAQTVSGAMTRYLLRNGLVLVVNENPASPLVGVVTRVGAGTAGEPAPGVAELAAELAAEAARPGGAVEERLRANGARLEVSVGTGATTFTTAIFPADVEDAAAAHAELLRAPALEPAAVRASAQALATVRDGPAVDPLSGALGRALAARSPRAPAPADAATPPSEAERVAAFLGERYLPDRTVLAVSGGVVAYDVLARVQRLYGGFGDQTEGAAATAPERSAPRAEAPALAPANEPEGLRYASERAGRGAAVVTVAYTAPPGADPDAPAVELLGAALAAGRGSRAARALRSTGLATAVSSVYAADAEAGTLAVQFATAANQLDAAEAAYFREADGLRRERLSEGELQRARNVFERGFRARFETAERAALTLAELEARFGDVRAARDYVGRVRAVTAEALRRAAARYLTSGRAAVLESLPADAPARSHTAGSFAALVASWAPGASRDVAPGEVREAEAVAAVPEGRGRGQSDTGDAVVLRVPQPVRDFSTLDGPRAFVREDQSRPVVTIGFFFPGGRNLEPLPASGSTELMLRSLLRGSKGSPGERALFALEQLGGEARVVNEPDFFGIVVEVLSRNADQAMTLAVDLLNAPSFDEEDVKRERAALLVDQLLARSRGLSRAAELFWQARYPTHPYGRPRLGLAETVSRITHEQLRAWFASAVRARYPLVGVVGDTDGSSLISRHVADGFEREEAEAPAAVQLPAAGSPAEAIEANGALTFQAIGFPGPAGEPESIAAVEVAAAAARERMAAELIGRRAVARALVWQVDQRRLGGAVLFAAATAPGDEGRAREVVFAELAKMAATPLPEAELQAARGAAALAHVRETESFDGRLVAYVRTAAFRVALEQVDTYVDLVRAVPAASVRQVSTSLFSPQRSARGVLR